MISSQSALCYIGGNEMQKPKTSKSVVGSAIFTSKIIKKTFPNHL